jgi:nitric oxide reductase NorD protein
MSKVDLDPWEPEETVGKLWHSYASRLDAPIQHHGATVDLSEIEGRLAIFFRGLGGDPSVVIRPVPVEVSRHRLSLRRRLGTDVERISHATYDGEALRLPGSIAHFPSREANAALYLWLTACAAHAPARHDDPDPLRADLRALAAIRAMTQETLEQAPGLRPLYSVLCQYTLHVRTRPALPAREAEVESLIRHLLSDGAALADGPDASPAPDPVMLAALDDPSGVTAPRGYRPFDPVALWPALRTVQYSAPNEAETRATDGRPPEEGSDVVKKAKRHKADQAERKDSLTLFNFETILSWAEFLNLNRKVEDDEFDNAKKAADDQDEIGLGQISKAPATRLKLHLDLAPEDVDRERLSGVFTYPEWEARSKSYLPDHTRVLASQAKAGDEVPSFRADPKAMRRIRAVKRQFEALQPGRIYLHGQPDGEELDMDAAVRSYSDLRAYGEGSDRVWRQSRPQRRDLAVSILLDVSRSTESAVTGRAVIDIEREALAALSWGLDACGDDFAIHAFSSLKRDRVYMLSCKEFGEPMSGNVEARIGSLKPGFYTRMGAAIRHASADLAKQAKKKRLLLVITDGKPNDLDHYEGRHGIEDTAMAIREARRAGHSVYGITVEARDKAWFNRMFGQGGYAIIAHPDKLTLALPEIYRHLVGA